MTLHMTMTSHMTIMTSHMTLTSNTQNKSSCFYQKTLVVVVVVATDVFMLLHFSVFPVSGFRFPNLKVNFVGGLISRVATSEHLQDQPRFYGGCIPKKLDRFKNQISVVKWSVFFSGVTENKWVDTCSAPAGVDEVEEVGWSPVSSRGFQTGDPEKQNKIYFYSNSSKSFLTENFD